MSVSANSRLRRLWLNIHLWIALTFAVLLVPISLSGALLVWHDHLDALINSGRYAVTAGQALPASALLAKAGEAVGQDFRPIVVRFPESAGWPATVNAREERKGEQGGRSRVMTVYLDPATGRVLDVSEFRFTLIGFLYRFHENLTIPEYEGRSIVGWVGVGMLIMSLSGIYLWWPRGGKKILRCFRWRRGSTLSLNLHHLFGFWVAIPLAVVSLTGIYLGFPQQGRQWLSSVAPMTAQQRGGFNAPLLRQTNLNADSALAAALNAEPGTQAAAIFLPTQQAQSWRVQLRSENAAGVMTVMIDDRSGAANKVVPLSGDRAAQWIRWIHEGSNAGLLWQVLVFLCGVLPTAFMITGVLIWLRSRAVKRVGMLAQGMPQGTPQTEPAE
jgi:uncharacterized iron-regulated membrane protein